MAVLESLVVYLGLFVAVYVLLVAEERVQSVWARFGCLSAAVLLPALLSGFRDGSVGSDTPMYLECIRTWAEQGMWTEQSERFEVGFKGLVQFFTGLSGSPHVVLTCFYILIFGVAMVAFDRLRSLAPVRLTYVFYLLICLVQSWNALRQTMACSFVLLGFAYLITGCPVRCLLAMALTVLFHKSSIFCLAVLPLACVSNVSSKAYLWLTAVFAVVGIAAVIKVVPEYAFYAESFTGETRHAFFKHLLTYGLLAASLLYWVDAPHQVRIFRWHKPVSRFLGLIALLAIALQLFHFSIDWADRLLVTFMPIIAFACTYAFSHGKTPAKIVSIAYVFPYSFLYHYIICNQNECNVFAFAF